MKKIIAIVLAIFMLCGFTGCGSTFDEWSREMISDLGFVAVKQLGSYGSKNAYIVYDPDTKVKYIFIDGDSTGMVLCPYYDENGNISFYEGE